MNDLKFICECIWYKKFTWSDNCDCYIDGSWEVVSDKDIIFRNDFMDKLVKYIDENDIVVDWLCDNLFMDLKVNMDYDNPVKFVLDTIQQ